MNALRETAAMATAICPDVTDTTPLAELVGNSKFIGIRVTKSLMSLTMRDVTLFDEKNGRK